MKRQAILYPIYFFQEAVWSLKMARYFCTKVLLSVLCVITIQMESSRSCKSVNSANLQSIDLHNSNPLGLQDES